MADADEDKIPSSSSHSHQDDLEDETQDFRFLTQLTSGSASHNTPQSQSTLPKRGAKDFEPNPTRSQANALDASRNAMHDALSAKRIHFSKSHIVGQYLPDERDWRFEGRCVVVYKFKSTHARLMGKADSRNWTWLLPEEALFLLERGTLDIRWPDEGGEKQEGYDDKQTADIAGDTDVPENQAPEVIEENAADNGEPPLGSIPMSLQGAYASFIGRFGLTLERYIVYASLKRLGYIVQRAPSWDDGHIHTNGHTSSPPSTSLTLTTTTTTTTTPSQSHNPISLIYRLLSWLLHPRGQGESCPSLGPLLAPGLYRNYNDIFRALSLIPSYDPTTHTYQTVSTTTPQTLVPSPSHPTSTSQPSTTNPPLRISLHIWKPNNAEYRKSAPPAPDYRLVILDSRTTSVPSMTQIGDLLDTMPTDTLPADKKLEMRLKHGVKNVLVAVVDSGVVSYLRFAEMVFAGDGRRLFEQKTTRGSKKRGGGGWRGRGRGMGKR